MYAGIFNGKVTAQKEIRLSLGSSPVAQATLKAALRELFALRAIGYHRNIVNLSGYSVSRGCVLLHIEYCEWDLDKLLNHLDLNIPLNIVANLTQQLFTGLKVIHDLEIVHRDIKPSNILLSSGSGLLKISDFGLARSATEAGCEKFPATREVCTR